MTSPSEPGAPKKGDSQIGDVSAERAGAHPRGAPNQAGRSTEGGDSPPWQRGAARAANPANRQSEPPTEARPQGQPSGVDARVNRFIAGGNTQAAGAPPQPKSPEFDASARGDGPTHDAYASELPDLSGGIPRGSQRKTTPERSSETSQSTGSARATSTEPRENRDSLLQVSRRKGGPVRATMQIRRIDPWSTLKVSLMLSVALFFVWMIAVAFLYLVLGGMGVWAKLNSNVGDLLNNTSGSSGELVSSGTIFGGAVLIGLFNIVLLTAMATIGAFVYNLSTDLIGGIEVTLADRD
ncbi:DUF3566 domain-containing protein [Mycobacterium montefiorense]|uniref:DUF3566 domain-containing protein n=1 Tax=Mycobacterium montefiorense TaxID=154654 RepID=A0AA37UR71_9MYCO|nr:DUF3566 domain-containing protein [Mycobacterium montefiorense]GBG40974.1 hypothetical protein MmonteBS_53460 [Mycobacterium montefiorense]GKU35114.1 hypothetical protein NJB14191_24600 [Mycobacterium montefiorense]GKU41201.1 hypothetical protein NJB14192_31850 [Mycobacterium montefiorense]GKU47821.1 hypothetical protein NJB14194_44390 [Mycobacterium montefiorense]GKU49478.1 hypothetical protein NJB14195_07250 [Mycobacterium montefiorense]